MSEFGTVCFVILRTIHFFGYKLQTEYTNKALKKPDIKKTQETDTCIQLKLFVRKHCYKTVYKFTYFEAAKLGSVFRVLRRDAICMFCALKRAIRAAVYPFIRRAFWALFIKVRMSLTKGYTLPLSSQ